MAKVLLIFGLFSILFPVVICQTNETAYDMETKALFLADYLVNKPDLFKRLLSLGDSVRGFLGGGKDPRFRMFGYYLLDQLPRMIESPETADIVSILTDELETVNTTKEVEDHARRYNITSLKRLQELDTEFALRRMDKIRTVRRILSGHSARDAFTVTKNDTVNDVCYDDMMNFLDAIIGVQMSPRTDMNFTAAPWAIKMLDSYGKPADGIIEGSVAWLGSYDLCQSVNAELPAGVILANRTLSVPVSFKGRYCRATFPIPPATIKKAIDDTHGMIFKLEWGMCVPDSCTGLDIRQMFNLGFMKHAGIRPENVTCKEDRDISEDPAAIGAAVILTTFVMLTFMTTVAEGVLDWIKNNIKSDYIGRHHFDDGNPSSEDGVNTKTYEEVRAGCICNSEENDVKVREGFSKCGEHHESDKKGTSEQMQNIITKSTERQHNQSLGFRLVKTFSVCTNLSQLLDVSKRPNTIHCLHGVRFFSLMWVLLGHTYNYGILTGSDLMSTANMPDFEFESQQLAFTGFLSLHLAVDTFFLLSGFLVSYITLKSLTKKKMTPGFLGLFYFHRIWRITPIYMIVLLTFTYLYKYLMDGPMWSGQVVMIDNCKINWWANLLYINNLVREGTADICMGWTWYLSVDMQLYIISPFFIFFLNYKPLVGIVLAVAAMCGSITSAFYNNYLVAGDLLMVRLKPDYWSEVYIKPWCRFSSYCVGLLLGYIMLKVKKGTLKNLPALCGWLVAFTVGMTLVYVKYDYRAKGSKPWTAAQMGALEAFERPVWCACVAWIIFACHQGKGGVIDNILSFRGFIPLSKLTYAAYLIHPMVMLIQFFNTKALLYMTHYEMAYLYMAHVICTYSAASVVSLLFEAPFLSLEKILLRRFV